MHDLMNEYKINKWTHEQVLTNGWTCETMMKWMYIPEVINE